MEDITKETGTGSHFKAVLPHGVTVRERKPMSEDTLSKDVPDSVYFLQNFNFGAVKVTLEHPYQDLETNEILSGEIQMKGYSCLRLGFRAG
ncbi:MAG: hypothetical protein LUH00_08480 [Lachnospiraceae bacterium]|nr:hypothetical protein [Lachnospiraceae bacterium]